MGRSRKYEKCFFCNKKFVKELGRMLDIIKTRSERKETGPAEFEVVEIKENIGKSFVCFQCEGPCSTNPEFNEDGSIKEKDKGY